jgi:excinuclease UvrABC nuclease subunit
MAATKVADSAQAGVPDNAGASISGMEKEEIAEILEREMKQAAENLDFERAARFRDELHQLKGTASKRKPHRYARRRQ